MAGFLFTCGHPIVGQPGVAVFQADRTAVFKAGTLQRTLHGKIIPVGINTQVAVILPGKGYAGLTTPLLEPSLATRWITP